MEIFAQEFEPASYFCDWTCVHLGMRRQNTVVQPTNRVGTLGYDALPPLSGTRQKAS